MSRQPVPALRRPYVSPAGRRRARSGRTPTRAPRRAAGLDRQPGLALPSLPQLSVLLLWVWCWAGLFGVLLFDGLRGSHPQLGWLPFWLLLWPATSLGLIALRRSNHPARA